MNTSLLGIDFGTTNTAAAFIDARGRRHEVRLSSTSTLMSSAVFIDSTDLVTGSRAQNLALTAPDCFEPNPKRRLGEDSIMLGTVAYDPIVLCGAVIAYAVDAATRMNGAPFDQVVLTHPDGWSDFLRRRLQRAGSRILDARISLVSEARAAAAFYTSTPGLAPDERICIFDFGAGTCDVAVMDRNPDGTYHVVAADGLDDLGGNDIDECLFNWVADQMAASQPDAIAALMAPRHRLNVLDRVREAKETLSDSPKAVIPLPVGDHPLQLTRAEFDEVIAPVIQPATTLTRRVLDAAQRKASRGPAKIYLVGGSSHIPLVHTQLAGVGEIATLGDPKTVVVFGALMAATSGDGRPPVPAVPAVPRGQITPARRVPPTAIPAPSDRQQRRFMPPQRDTPRQPDRSRPVTPLDQSGPPVSPPPLAGRRDGRDPNAGAPARSSVPQEFSQTTSNPATTRNLVVLAGVVGFVVIAITLIVAIPKLTASTPTASSTTTAVDTPSTGSSTSASCADMTPAQCTLARKVPSEFAGSCFASSTDTVRSSIEVTCGSNTLSSEPYYQLMLYDYTGSTMSAATDRFGASTRTATFPEPTSSASWEHGKVYSTSSRTSDNQAICSTNTVDNTAVCVFYEPSARTAAQAYRWWYDNRSTF